MSHHENIEIPPDLYYTNSHEWAKLVEGDVLVGISAFAVEEMGRDIVHIELPSVGQKVKQLESFGVIDSVKAAFDLYAPVSGEVVEVNAGLLDDPSPIAQSPYDKGWMIRISPSSIAQLDTILKAEAYRNMLEAEDTAH
jgi:glycine cleavage system H protein